MTSVKALIRNSFGLVSISIVLHYLLSSGIAYAQFSSSGAEQISVGTGGAAPDGFSSDVSGAPNGDITVFTSAATNLLPNDNNGVTDVFQFSPSKGVELISVSTITGSFAGSNPNAQGSNSAGVSSVLPDGTYAVGFVSDLLDLVPNYQTTGDINPSQVYLRLPRSNQTILISTGIDSTEAAPRGANAPCDAVSVVALANPTRFIVLFRTAASNLNNDLPLPQPIKTIHMAFVAFENSVPKIIRRESANRLPNGRPIDRDINFPVISGDGRFVAFSTTAAFSQDTPGNGKEQVFVYDRSSKFARMISINQNGNPGNNDSFKPSISFQGEVVGFITRATDIIPRAVESQIAVVHTLQTKTIAQVNTAADGSPSDGSAYNVKVSPGAKLLVISDDGSNLAPNPGPVGVIQVYMKDPSLGTIVRTSATSAGVAGDGNSGGVSPHNIPNSRGPLSPLSFGSLGFNSPIVFTSFRSVAQNLTRVGISSEVLPNVFRATITPPKPRFKKNAVIEAPPDIIIKSSLPNGGGASVTIQLQEFDDSNLSNAAANDFKDQASNNQLKYNLEIRKAGSRDRIFRTLSRNSTTIRKVSPGRYTVRYRVTKTTGKTTTTSKYSPKSSLEIT